MSAVAKCPMVMGARFGALPNTRAQAWHRKRKAEMESWSPSAGEVTTFDEVSPELHIHVRDSADVIAARLEARHLGFHLGFGERALTAIATALSEVTRDLMAHGKEAELDLAFAMGKHRVGLKVIVHS